MWQNIEKKHIHKSLVLSSPISKLDKDFHIQYDF